MNLPSPLLPRDKFASFIPDHVYDPAEDSFLLLDALQQCINQSLIKPSICIEVGVGSGAIIVALKKAFGPTCLCIGTDINEYAGRCTNLCASVNGIGNSIEIVLTDLTRALGDRLHGSVDLLIFNPPYVATEEQECHSHSIQASWAGGTSGTDVIWRFIDQADRLLSPGGHFFLVLEKVNRPHQVTQQIENKYPIKCDIVMDRRCGIEHLFIVRGVKKRTC